MSDVHMNLYLDLDTVLELACIVLALLALLAAALAFGTVRRLKARNAGLETGITALQGELQRMVAQGMRAGHNVQRLQRELSVLSDRLGSMEMRGAARPYDQAIDSARRGADPSTLTEQFGLSRGEADLVSRLHGRRKSA
jgi:hypothetical protein